MPSNYTGNPSAVQSPAVAPAPGIAPVLALPIDADAFNSAAFAQEFKCLADYTAWLMSSYQRSVFTDEWMIPQTNFNTAGAVTNMTWWKISVGGSPTGLSTAVGTSSYPSNTMKINPGTVTATSLYLYTAQQFVTPAFTNLSLTLQFDALLTVTNSNCAVYFGMVAGTDPTTSDGVWFRYDPNVLADTVWKAVTKATTSTVTSTGVTPLTTMQNFKIVFAPTSVKFFINGSLVATNSTTIPTTNMSLLFGSNTNSANTCIPTIGPVYCSWNRT